MESHKTLSFQSAIGLEERKLILAFPKTAALDNYSQEIDIQDINTYYDHTLYFSEQTYSKIFQHSRMEFVEESITITYTNPEKKPKLILAPRGQFIKINDKYFELIQSSLKLWLKEERVFWLKNL